MLIQCNSELTSHGRIGVEVPFDLLAAMDGSEFDSIIQLIVNLRTGLHSYFRNKIVKYERLVCLFIFIKRERDLNLDLFKFWKEKHY